MASQCTHIELTFKMAKFDYYYLEPAVLQHKLLLRLGASPCKRPLKTFVWPLKTFGRPNIWMSTPNCWMATKNGQSHFKRTEGHSKWLDGHTKRLDGHSKRSAHRPYKGGTLSNYLILFFLPWYLESNLYVV